MVLRCNAFPSVAEPDAGMSIYTLCMASIRLVGGKGRRFSAAPPPHALKDIVRAEQ